jgi:hypothetical protein
MMSLNILSEAALQLETALEIPAKKATHWTHPTDWQRKLQSVFVTPTVATELAGLVSPCSSLFLSFSLLSLHAISSKNKSFIIHAITMHACRAKEISFEFLIVQSIADIDIYSHFLHVILW